MAAPTHLLMRLLLLLIVLGITATAEAQERPAQEDLDEVTRLGRMLYGYDQAAWRGTDAVLPIMQRDGIPLDGTGPVRGYIAEPVEAGWRLAFGKLNADSTAFLVAYEAGLDSTYTVTGVQEYDEPEARTGFMRDAMIGLEVARSRFPFEQISYNFPVLPAPDGKLYVYIVPAQPDVNVYYLGGDARYTFDPANGQIEEKRLHSSIMTMDLRDEPTAGTYSSAVLTPIPTETDVFYALSRPSRGPGEVAHIVLTEPWTYLIGQDGAIVAMATEVFQNLQVTSDGRDVTTEPQGGN